MRNVASLRERISKEIELQNDSINQLRGNLTEMIENQGLEIKENRKIVQNNFETAEKENLVISERIRGLSMSIENIEAVLQNHREMHREKAMRIEEFSEVLNKHREELANLQDSRQLAKKLQEYVKQMDNELARA